MTVTLFSFLSGILRPGPPPRSTTPHEAHETARSGTSRRTATPSAPRRRARIAQKGTAVALDG